MALDEAVVAAASRNEAWQRQWCGDWCPAHHYHSIAPTIMTWHAVVVSRVELYLSRSEGVTWEQEVRNARVHARCTACTAVLQEEAGDGNRCKPNAATALPQGMHAKPFSASS